MNQFNLLPDAAKRLRKAVYLQFLGTITVVALGIVIIRTMDTAPLNLTFQNPSTFIVSGVMLLLFYGHELRKATLTGTSFKLTISDETITREVDGAATRTIPLHQVRFISKWSDGSYVITGNDMMKPIVVPVGIGQPQELEGVLNALTTVSIQAKNFHLYNGLIAFMLTILTMMGALLASNKYVGTIFGVLFIGAVVYSWAVIQRGKDYDRKIRLITHLILVPAVVVAVRVIWHWT